LVRRPVVGAYCRLVVCRHDGVGLAAAHVIVEPCCAVDAVAVITKRKTIWQIFGADKYGGMRVSDMAG
jgi:hypothetical protein